MRCIAVPHSPDAAGIKPGVPTLGCSRAMTVLGLELCRACSVRLASSSAGLRVVTKIGIYIGCKHVVSKCLPTCLLLTRLDIKQSCRLQLLLTSTSVV
jgi:hypothetical protein